MAYFDLKNGISINDKKSCIKLGKDKIDSVTRERLEEIKFNRSRLCDYDLDIDSNNKENAFLYEILKLIRKLL